MKLNNFTKSLLQLLDYWRRELIYLFDKDYFNKKIAARRGKCKKCGDCCVGCEYLDEKTRLCKTYYNRDVPHCHIEFPLDRVDQHIWGLEKTCGYKFPKKK